MSLEEIEREAAAEIQRRVDSGKPPPEEWSGLPDMSVSDADMDRLGSWSSPAPAGTATEPMEPAPVEPVSMPADDAPPPPAPTRAARPAAARRKAAPKAASSATSTSKAGARKPATAKPATRARAAAGGS